MINALRDSEIPNLNPPPRRGWLLDNKDVARLEVAVSKAFIVHNAEPIEQVSADVLDIILRNGPSDVTLEVP
ncbi:hypothetical protein PEBR_25836 [Penicillium brasilianum]|uniref:Uncharacterized protein n=1 Tax=Penicillium brasilianum TaxID=104259 RepID=A0A1S9RJM7_PENBI|nr:hypothetical protein PEBR_25836 [Penicillium brasilianum]